MAGRLIEEPLPRSTPLPWAAWLPPEVEIVRLNAPENPPDKGFQKVLETRRSVAGSEISWHAIAELLWHGARTREWLGTGRAGIPTEHRAASSAGGLHPISFVCQMCGSTEPPRLYLSGQHSFAILHGASPDAGKANEIEVSELAAAVGCTIRFVADYEKTSAAYLNSESLIWRDAGVAIGTLGLVAQWLAIRSRPLGLVGSGHLSRLGFASERFMAVGALQVGR